VLTGKELKIERIKKDIKAVDIAEHLHIHKSYISKLEREVQSIPKQLYEKWVEFLGLDAVCNK
jgi:transcriptional regulator with XRE-family HTH domain